MPEGPEPCKPTRGKTTERFLCTICSTLNQSIIVEEFSAESGVLEAKVLSQDPRGPLAVRVTTSTPNFRFLISRFLLLVYFVVVGSREAGKQKGEMALQP